MLRRLSAARATQNTSRACALCGILLRHIFAVAGTLRVPSSQPQKLHIQPERYTTCQMEVYCSIPRHMEKVFTNKYGFIGK